VQREEPTEYKRITADLHPEVYQQLSEIAEWRHGSKVMAISSSLELHHRILKETRKGNKIIVETQEGQRAEIWPV
jgi:hypothetical protein